MDIPMDFDTMAACGSMAGHVHERIALVHDVRAEPGESVQVHEMDE